MIILFFNLEIEDCPKIIKYFLILEIEDCPTGFKQNGKYCVGR